MCLCCDVRDIIYWLFCQPVKNLARMKILMSLLRAIEAVNNKYSINYISMLKLRAIKITKNEKKSIRTSMYWPNGNDFHFVSFHFVSFDLISIVPFWFVCQNVWRKSQCVSHDAYIHACNRWICIGVIQQLLVIE